MDIKELNEVSPLSIQLATSAWTKPKTEKIEMDTRLAEEFAFILYEEIKKPNLGNATTGELIDEIASRLGIPIIAEVMKHNFKDKLNYKTTNYK
jgi:hypothetical protein